jgi:CheY-like chemotaxis protein
VAERLKVLVVDDEPVALEVTRAVLEKLGHEVVTRESALGTTAAIVRERPDIVLLDIVMPGIPGDELLRAIRQRDLLRGHERTQFILYSGLASSKLERLVEETGALGSIEKTADPAAFACAFTALTRRP